MRKTTFGLMVAAIAATAAGQAEARGFGRAPRVVVPAVPCSALTPCGPGLTIPRLNIPRLSVPHLVTPRLAVPRAALPYRR